MSEEFTAIRWQDVEDLPEGARVQNDAKAKVTTAYFPYYFRDANGKAKAERDYIGTVVNRRFTPNLYYVQNHPTRDNRPPERWKDVEQRKKAFARQKFQEQLKEASDWFNLELTSKEDITRQIGATALCARVLYEENLIEDVARALDYSVADTMHALNLAIFMALTSKASYLAFSESEVCKFLGFGCLSSQRISEFLHRIGSSLQLSSRLSKFRTQRMTSDGDLIAVDGTFLDSNSTQIAAAAVGKRKDGTFGPQINFSMVSNATTGVPLGYRWYSGDTHDVKTLDDLKELWEDFKLNRKDVEFIWDRGYFDAQRMAEFDLAGFKFISGTKVGLNIIQEIIDARNSDFYSAKSLLQHHYCYGIADDVDLNGDTSAKAYVYFNPNKQMIETRELRDELEKAQRKWMEGKLKANDPIMRFFLDPVKGEELKIDEREFDEECFIRGFFACISNTDQSADQVLDKYRTRNEVEVLFRLMIGRLLDTTRVHSSTVLEGLLFCVFIALSILSRLRKILQTKVPSRKNVRAANCDVIDFDKTYSLDDYVTITEMLNELRGITATVSHKSGKARLFNLSEKKKQLVADMGLKGLFDSADDVWDLLSARRLSETIRELKAADQASH